jgi:uncharacterized protein YdhG (YjbR/CyaY superfamily)
VAKTRFSSVSEYIASKPKDARVTLAQVRNAIRRAIPDAEESLAYQMPVYTLNGVAALYFAGWKAHFSLYPVGDAIASHLERELTGYERTKGGLKVPFSKPVPVKLIERIARLRAGQLTARDKGSGRRKGRVAQLERLRRMCATLPSVAEKLSHGTPTFFVEKNKGVFAMFSDHHHEDGRLALWVPVAEGVQPLMIEESPATYFNPPYVGSSGWIGIDLAAIRDDALQAHLREAWRLVAAKMKKPASRRRMP